MDRVEGDRVGIELRTANLGSLDPRVLVPAYDRGALGRGIVHIGVGSFHRAHQAAYLDDLCGKGVTDWSITGSGVLPGDAAMAQALGAQDHLYTLVTRDLSSTTVRVVGSITDYVLASPDMGPLVERLADPATRVVTLTITEGGYPVDEATRTFVPPASGLPPAFEAIARALRIRRDEGLPGLTVLSCDNVMHNGVIARAATLGAAAVVEPGLEVWAERNVAFPNSMVDRITPATTDADRAFLAERYGVVDRWPVVAETFIQWVIEDAFPYGRPPYEDAGVLFTTDVTPYETLKLRLLNAGHSTMAYLAALAGIVFVHEVMADPLFARYLQRFHDEEAGPSLPPVAGIDVEQYKRTVADRFANPEVKDQVARICQDGTSKFPKFLIPTVEGQLERGRQVRLSALALAGWCQYLSGRDEAGREIVLSYDPRIDTATRYSAASRSDPLAFLGMAEVFPARLAADPAFAPAFVEALTSIREVGVRASLERWLGPAA